MSKAWIAPSDSSATWRDRPLGATRTGCLELLDRARTLLRCASAIDAADAECHSPPILLSDPLRQSPRPDPGVGHPSTSLFLPVVDQVRAV
jgi:hypothetical protein